MVIMVAVNHIYVTNIIKYDEKLIILHNIGCTFLIYIYASGSIVSHSSMKYKCCDSSITTSDCKPHDTFC